MRPRRRAASSPCSCARTVRCKKSCAARWPPSSRFMLELFVSAFVTLFVVIDPPGCAPIYAGLSAHAGPAQRRSMALRACLIAGAILLLFALFGEQLLSALHIELDAFRIAGGIMVFLIALDM